MFTAANAMRAARVFAVVTIIGVGVAAFVLSFAALRDLAKLAQVPAEWAWCLPVVIDGTIIQATLGVLVLAHSPERRCWFVRVLAVGAAVSIAGNSLHAVAAGRELPWWISAMVAAIAPISLLVDTHGLAVLVRAAQHNSASIPTGVSTPTELSTESAASVVESVSADPAVEVPARQPVSVPAPKIRPAVVPVRPIRPMRPVQQTLPIAGP
ncbi:DUF2637 domain-containing protein [Nocardia arthritidis]|uniref:DUF2637 domain-containing protein n=1 Tax=Nocardia arthritidis TaxID=228602 RepID=A0A6G9Y8J8_9NOCA|nr:DUF2637 domain-containing protein [Nocardia arthritidis]QIS09383.1 DUF2637 domain-containing protein [Nocardia arthritidis]